MAYSAYDVIDKVLIIASSIDANELMYVSTFLPHSLSRHVCSARLDLRSSNPAPCNYGSVDRVEDELGGSLSERFDTPGLVDVEGIAHCSAIRRRALCGDTRSVSPTECAERSTPSMTSASFRMSFSSTDRMGAAAISSRPTQRTCLSHSA